ncbi:MAG: DUF4886 domain-containing protein [Clostridia bacterium]|nr:DUF4886 domain-containing protein [Clostridia bacterium]
MKVLSIGNSFSQDAHRWLKDICVNGGVDADFYNLYIGGCSLERHWAEFCSGEESYDYEINAEKTRKISLKEALSAEKWDIVTLQQASYASGRPETYQPYLKDLVAEVKKVCPGAKLYMHQTWAYDAAFQGKTFEPYHFDQQEMFARLAAAYQKAAEELGVPLISVGAAIQKLRSIPPFDTVSLNRDGFHLSHLYGRYLAGLVWYQTLFGGDPAQITFIPEYDGEIADPALLKTIQKNIKAE